MLERARACITVMFAAEVRGPDSVDRARAGLDQSARLRAAVEIHHAAAVDGRRR